MLLRWQYNVLLGTAVLALLLVVANATMFSLNRSQQAGLTQRQQFVSQTIPLEGLYNDIVKTLAQMAVKGNDRQVLNMLAAQGIGVTVNAPGTAGTPAAKEAP